MVQQKARVLCEYSPRENLGHREVMEITIMCDGDLGEHVTSALAKIYPSWQHPVIIDIRWHEPYRRPCTRGLALRYGLNDSSILRMLGRGFKCFGKLSEDEPHHKPYRESQC